MKSFFSLSRHFIIALIVVIGVGIYVGLKQPSEHPVTAKVPSSPPISSTHLTPPLRVPSPNQVATATDDIYELSTVSPNTPNVPSKSISTEMPTHFSYQEENTQNLVEIGTYFDRVAYLSREAAEAFKQMQLAAQQEDIQLVPISGFRSVADQNKLFQRQIQRQGSPKAAERLSAPPGFSEHHTGYALDISDGKHQKNDLKVAFDSTEAYRWLKVHASQYGFELSFTKNNLQGVSYEPWHWRFVGSPTAKEIFREARTDPSQSPQ